MSTWSLEKRDELVLQPQIPDKPLGDDSVRQQLVEARVASPLVEKQIPGVSFVLDAGAAASVEAFNAPGDVDAQGVVGSKASQVDDKQLAPVLLLGQGKGWLKYSAEVRAKAGANLSLPLLSVDASGEVRALVADYRAHGLEENVRAALLADAGALRLPLSPESLRGLGLQDALTFQVRGTLKVSAHLKWADVFTTNLQLLGKLAPNVLIGLDVDVGATLDAEVELADDYQVTFSRPEQGRIYIALKKVAARRADIAPQVGVGVSIKAPESVAQQVNAVLTALLARPVAEFESLLDRLAQAQLPPELKEALRFALDRLGLEDLEADPAALKQKWEELKASLPSRIEELARQKVALGFAYEYGRLSQGSTLLAVSCTEDQAVKLLGPLVLGRLDQVVSGLQAEGVKPERYLLEEIATTSRAWGFSLQLGKWAVGGKDRSVLKEVVQQSSMDSKGPRRLSYLGTREYKGDLLKPYIAWTVDFKCDMAEFRPDPSAADFQYGLYMLLQNPPRKHTKDTLRQLVDDAIVWRVLDDADEEQLINQVLEAAGGAEVETRLELKVDDRTFREVLQEVARPDAPQVFARALARALPWYSVPCRNMPEVRESTYAPLWQAFLRDGGWTPRDAARSAGNFLKGKPLVGTFYLVEGAVATNGQVGNGTVTFAEVISKNPGAVQKWQAFRGALLQLRNDIAGRRPPEGVKQAFAGLESCWGQSFYLLATGAFLLELAGRGSRGLEAVERTLTVEIPGKSRQFIFTRSRK